MGRPKLDPTEQPGRTPHRTVRVPDDLWARACQAAEAQGTNTSKLIRDLLEAHLAHTPGS